MDPVRAKAISIVLLHFWPLFCQRAVCHDSLSLSLPLSLPFSPPVSLSFPCLWHCFYSAVCQSRQQMQWKAKAEPLPDFYSLSLPSPPPFLSSSPQLVMENLHNTLCNYERDNATSTPLSHLLFISFSACWCCYRRKQTLLLTVSFNAAYAQQISMRPSYALCKLQLFN